MVLGRFGVVRSAELHADPPGVPGRALRILAVRRRLHVEELSELLWPGAEAQSGRARLRNVVSRIRAAVGPVVERSEDLIGLAADVEVDIERFEQLAKRALAAAAEDALAGAEDAAAEAEPYDDDRLLRAAELCLDAGRRGAAAAMLERAGQVNGRLGVPAAERFEQLTARLRG